MVQTARSPPDWRLAVSSCSASSSLNFTRMWMAYLSKALQPSKSGQPQYRETWPLHPMLRSMRRKCSSTMPTMRLTSGSQLSCMAYQGTSGATLQLSMLPGLSVCCIGESLLSSTSPETKHTAHLLLLNSGGQRLQISAGSGELLPQIFDALCALLILLHTSEIGCIRRKQCLCWVHTPVAAPAHLLVNLSHHLCGSP